MLNRIYISSFLILTEFQSANAIGRTLADCLATASMFDNTCSSINAPIAFVNHEGEVMSCSGLQRCPGGSTATTFGTGSQACSWQRKLCVTCSEEDSEVYIRVQSNSLPNHCFYSKDTNPVETETDWKVKFNPNVNGQIYYPHTEKDVDTSLGIQGCAADTEETVEKKRRVLVIGLDGARPDSLMLANTPAIDKLMANGLSTMEAMTNGQTVTKSSPGWHSIVTGVDPIKHGIPTNGVYLFRNFDYKSFLWHAHNDYGLKTMAVTQMRSHMWESTIEKDAVDFKVNQDLKTAVDVDPHEVILARELVENDYDVTFWMIKHIDRSGHAYEFGPESPIYMENIEMVDDQIG